MLWVAAPDICKPVPITNVGINGKPLGGADFTKPAIFAMDVDRFGTNKQLVAYLESLAKRFQASTSRTTEGRMQRNPGAAAKEEAERELMAFATRGLQHGS